ncbi:MAG TPA: hypothetical protein VHE30_27480 [Polyangiaceae bacterium]|nr:hypothetical protein [Polyangiaceae bacterium]
MASTERATEAELERTDRASMTREIGSGDGGTATALESGTPPPLESGIPPARSRFGTEPSYLESGDEHLELALAESTRAEANLNGLLRGLNHLLAGTRAARDANAALARELDTARDQLERASADEMVLRHRVRALEQALAQEKRETARERTAFVAQEDAFLAELLADHEREVRDLRQRLSHALARIEHREAAPPAEPTPLGALRLKSVKIPLPQRDPLRDDAERLEPPRPSSRPPLRQKADPSTRPLVDYRFGGDDVREERLEGAARSSRPPPSDRDR